MATTQHSREVVKLCEHLDLLAIKFLTKLSQVITLRKHLEETMKEGYIQMAKARYVLGNRRVSSLQLNTSQELEATVHLQRVQATIEDTDAAYSKVDFLKDTEENEKDSLSLQESSETSGLRKRIGGNTMNSTESSEAPKSNETKSSSVKKNDVLKWFGVLVPMSLKDSQKRFTKAVELAIEITNLQNEVQVIMDLYKQNLKEKMLLLKNEHHSEVENEV